MRKFQILYFLLEAHDVNYYKVVIIVIMKQKHAKK